MLDVYTVRTPRPADSIDLSTLPLDELSDALQDICAHQTQATVWLGYLDGWMLSQREEILVRPALRKLTCVLVTAFPLALPHAWQNEINKVFTGVQ
jgi:hypothetical protein